MGQVAQRSANLMVWVCEPILVPDIYGRAFVVLRIKSGGATHVERIESFPSQRTLPVSFTGTAEAIASVLVIEVVTAADVESFLADTGVRQFATVSVPLHEFVHLWQPASLEQAAQAFMGPTGPSTGPADCIWLGLDQDTSLLGSGVEPEVLFGRAKQLGTELTAPKVGIMLRAAERLPAEDSQGAATAGTASGSKSAPSVDPVQEVFVQANALMLGLHNHVQESVSTGSNYETLQAENAQLRMAITQQRQKYEGLTERLRTQVEEASAATQAAPTEGDAEVQRLREQLHIYRDAAHRLKSELKDQATREEGIQRHVIAARLAKDETSKLLVAKNMEVQQLGVELQASRRIIAKLQRQWERLQTNTEVEGTAADSSARPETIVE